MSEPVGPLGEPDGENAVQVEQPAGRRVRAGRWVRRRGARWVAVGAVVVVLGGGAAAVAAHRHEESRHAMADGGPGGPKARMKDGRDGGFGPDAGRHQHRDAFGKQGGKVVGPAAGTRAGIAAAPAPLPALAAQQAVEKAAAAVSGGRVESLAVVPQQGGGTAWAAVVVGPDGVRHRVTVDGAGGEITGNTVVGEPAGGPAR